MNYIFLLFLTLFINSCTTSCSQKKEQEIVAQVNNVAIFKNEVDSLQKKAFINTKDKNLNKKIKSEVRASIIKKLIDNEMLRQEAKKYNLEPDRFERVAMLKEYKNNLGGPKHFQYFLEQKGFTEEQILDAILTDKRKERLISHLNLANEPSEEEIAKYYKENQNLFGLPEMAKASHILLKLSNKDHKEKEKLVLEKAEKIFKEAISKKDSFELLVDKYSEGESIKNKGDIGYFARGKMVKNFEDACFDNPVGSIIGPIKTDFGYHIIKITDKLPQRIGLLEEIKPSVIKQIQKNNLAKATENLLINLRKNSLLTLNDSSFSIEEFKKSTFSNVKTAEN